ncbi:MAG: ribosome small subunit-dependent GTPase A [Acidobacteria bacterium]|nr:ribosome small subunit-dependent GTPase A [Acidobacteriota bacterium]
MKKQDDQNFVNRPIEELSDEQTAPAPSPDELALWGWNDFFSANFREFSKHGMIPGRVSTEFNKFYKVQTSEGEKLAEIAGRMKHEAQSRSELPAVGDWVALRLNKTRDSAVIHALLPRRSRFARKSKGSKTEEQIVGANIDTVFLVTSLNQDFNPRRIERYLAVVWESGATPVVLLTKTDLCEDVTEKTAIMLETARGVEVHPVCAIKDEGLDALQKYFVTGQTVALIGSSGVGKSTIINRLIGSEKQKVLEVREHDDRGMHTTRHRELILLPAGGIVLDTPGMREFQLWGAEDGIETTFDDIEALAAHCQFTDCKHQTEPRCAVRHAIESGALAVERFDNYLKLQQELSFLARRQDHFAQKQEQNRWKKLSRLAEERAKAKRK